MASVDRTVDALINDIKLAVAVPANQQLYSNNDLINLINKSMTGTIVGLIDSCRSNFFTDYQDYTINTTKKFKIPQNAIGNVIQSVCYVDNNENEYQLPLIQFTEIEFDIFSRDCYWIDKNSINLITQNPIYNTLRVYYNRRPNTITSRLLAGKVSLVSGNDVTLDNVPSTFTVGETITIQSPNPPFELKDTGVTITNVASSIITVDDASNIAINDYITLDNFAIIPELPTEAIELLITQTAVHVLTGLDDETALKIQYELLKQQKQDLVTLLSPRVQRQPEKIKNRRGIFSQRGF